MGCAAWLRQSCICTLDDYCSPPCCRAGRGYEEGESWEDPGVVSSCPLALGCFSSCILSSSVEFSRDRMTMRPGVGSAFAVHWTSFGLRGTLWRLLEGSSRSTGVKMTRCWGH